MGCSRSAMHSVLTEVGLIFEMMNSVYLDYAATTPVDPDVAKSMSDCLTLEGNFANPASRSHRFGWQAEQAVEQARKQVADAIAAEVRELVWTSGATESNNLAIKGVVEAWQQSNPQQTAHIISSCIEHKAVIDTIKYLEQKGTEVTWLAPDDQGLIYPEQVQQALKENTILVSLMAVNNELGTITDVKAIGSLLSQHPAYFHVDGAQALGKLPIDVTDWQVDLLSLSAHKCYGPKGVGALYVKRQPQVKLAAQMHGGGHERGMRSGTLATHQLVGFGAAASHYHANSDRFEQELAHIAQLRDRLWQGLHACGGVILNGHLEQRVSHHLNVSFEAIDGEILLASLARVAVSSGSACTSASIEPSYVLKAIGRSDDLAHAGIRFSLGRYSTEQEVNTVIAEVTRILQQLRS